MPRISLRPFTPALVGLGLIVGIATTTSGALPSAAATHANDGATATQSQSQSQEHSLGAPLSTIAAKAQSALDAAETAILDAARVTLDVAASGLDVGVASTTIDTTALRQQVAGLKSVDVTPALLVPALTSSAVDETAAVNTATAALRGALDGAIQRKAEEEAAAAAAAQAAAEAAAAAAQAEAEAAAAAQAAAKATARPAVNVNVDPASAQGIARTMASSSYGWGDDQFSCLVALWDKESGWNAGAYNASSGAYGIPQALPGSKMASAGADWETNPATQIAWGLGYISGRYGSPCGAWDHSTSVGWY